MTFMYSYHKGLIAAMSNFCCKYKLIKKKVASNLEWPKVYWVILFESVLVGRVREI